MQIRFRLLLQPINFTIRFASQVISPLFFYTIEQKTNLNILKINIQLIVLRLGKVIFKDEGKGWRKNEPIKYINYSLSLTVTPSQKHEVPS